MDDFYSIKTNRVLELVVKDMFISISVKQTLGYENLSEINCMMISVSKMLSISIGWPLFYMEHSFIQHIRINENNKVV